MPFFDIFASRRRSPLRMRTKVVSFSFFSKSFQTNKKKKALRPKMTKIASRWSCLKPLCVRFLFFSSCNVRMRCVSYHTNFLQAIPCINPNFDHLLYFFYLSNACLFSIFFELLLQEWKFLHQPKRWPFCKRQTFTCLVITGCLRSYN